MMHTSVHTSFTRRPRGPSKNAQPGDNRGAQLLFALYRGEDANAREAIIAAVAEKYADKTNPRQRATLAINGWTKGHCKPMYPSRLTLAPWIPMASWDIASVPS